MSDSKKVLVEATAVGGVPNIFRATAPYGVTAARFYAPDTAIHAHPGVTVAALQREADLAEEIIGNVATTIPTAVAQQYEDWLDFCTTREDANRPELAEGQEVVVKGRVNHHGTISFRAPKPQSIHDVHQWDVDVHPDDIRVTS